MLVLAVAGSFRNGPVNFLRCVGVLAFAFFWWCLCLCDVGVVGIDADGQVSLVMFCSCRGLCCTFAVYFSRICVLSIFASFYHLSEVPHGISRHSPASHAKVSMLHGGWSHMKDLADGVVICPRLLTI